MLGGAYGRRVVVVAGMGNYGYVGRDGARRLRRRGVRVDVRDAATVGPGERLDPCDLVIDAAYGTGFRGDYAAPDPVGAPVLSVDIPSGIDGLTGAGAPDAVRADLTVTFAALKPGLVFHPGRAFAGDVAVIDIGLDTSTAQAHVVEASDIVAWLPTRPTEAHKWKSAVWIVAGSPGMTGAADLAARGAQRAGAGYVRLSAPGGGASGPVEVVRIDLPHVEWDGDVLDGVERFRALVVGPGLGVDPATAPAVRRVVKESPIPTVVDGDALTALGTDVAEFTHPLSVLTPHDGEYERLMGSPPGPNRIDAARMLAEATKATVLLKGATTVVADGEGRTLVVTAGDARLATAGTGDVLSGIIGSLMAQGVHPLRAAAAGAWLHGRAAARGPAHGFVASDIVSHLPALLDDLAGDQP
jgi:NAD(P)H-hydrate epimerase